MQPGNDNTLDTLSCSSYGKYFTSLVAAMRYKYEPASCRDISGGTMMMVQVDVKEVGLETLLRHQRNFNPIHTGTKQL